MRGGVGYTEVDEVTGLIGLGTKVSGVKFTVVGVGECSAKSKAGALFLTIGAGSTNRSIKSNTRMKSSGLPHSR